MSRPSPVTALGGDAPPAPDSRPSAGRAPGGRWAPGASGNPRGRAPRAREETLDAVTRAVCSLDEWREIVAKAVTMAKAGDPRARDWLGRVLRIEAPARPDATVRGPLEVVFVNDWKPPLAEGDAP